MSLERPVAQGGIRGNNHGRQLLSAFMSLRLTRVFSRLGRIPQCLLLVLCLPTVALAGTTVGSGDIALIATATVSSQDTSTGQLGSKAIDGIVDGYPGDYTKEWATVGQLSGAWIRLTWASPVTLGQIILHDRPNVWDNVLAGTIQFSDGSSINVGQLPNDGTGLVITFSSRTVSWVQFNITNAVGYNIGLAEFEAYAP